MRKLTKRIVPLILVVVMCVCMAAPAFASTTDSVGITRTINGSSYTHSNVREKDNDSSTYLYITSSSVTHTYVKASAYDSAGNYAKSCTLVNGSYAANVVCRRYVQYNVHNSVYESGYRLMALGFMNLTDSISSVTFTWSPDSSGTYTSATGITTPGEGA